MTSMELSSYLTPEGAQLRLVDAQGRVRLTQAEAEQDARLAERSTREHANRS